jgi:hypothetical protein
MLPLYKIPLIIAPRKFTHVEFHFLLVATHNALAVQIRHKADYLGNMRQNGHVGDKEEESAKEK